MNRWRKPDWARLTAIEAVEWSDNEEPHYENIWQRPNAIPLQGSLRAVSLMVAPPTTPSFWMVFQPALSCLNGWLDNPEELEQSALVEVKLLSTFEHNWVLVEVLQVIAFTDLADYFPPSSDGDIDELLEKPYPSTSHVHHKNWHYLHSDYESDIGWWLVFTDDGVTLSILIYGHYSPGGSSEVYSGNRLLSDEEHQHMLAVLAKIARDA